MYMMKPSAIVILLFLIVCFQSSESKLQQQSSVDDDDDDDDWDEDEDEDGAYPKPEVDDDGRIYKNPRNSPSAMCPRDEEQAELLSQKCLRKCSTDEDCKSKKKKCRCDGACGMSCIKPDRECPELTDIQHGVMMVTGKLFGDRTHYTCDHDYFIVGLSERTCRADGHWTGTAASCKKEANSFCSDPPKINNARHNALIEQTTFDLDSMVQYFCNHGYVTTGFPKAKCLMMDGAASWFGPDIACEPQNCGAPTDIANGWHAGECYTFDCRVSYHCADGYELVGRAEKTCLADGTWVPKELPQCVQVTAVQCPPPENPRHGKAVYTSCAYNSIVSYECKYSFTIVGVATRRCGADGRWSGQLPACKEINCGSPGILYNGWIENIESGTGLGASIIFRCNDHMKLEGNTSSVCQIDGKWRYPLPQCLAPCVVPQIENGHIIVASRERDHINNVTVVEHGERLIVKCVQNYEFAANSTPVICNNGTWSIIPACSPARCKQMPKTPKNGIVIAPKTDHGMRAVFMCKDGFELVGGDNSSNSTIFVECRYGNWTGEMPHCMEVYCPFPGYITNGKVLLVGNMGVYDYRPYVRKVVNNKQIMYDCDRGYVLSEGPPGATCIGGNWSPKQLPKCIPGQHPRLRWSRRRRSTVESSRKDTETVSCKKFVDLFKKISKRVLHLQMGRANDRTKHGVDSRRSLTSNGNLTVRGSRKKYPDRKNHTQVRDERMIDFLRIVYEKLVRIDSKEPNVGTNLSTHDLLNVVSKNFFHVDLQELSLKNSSTLSGERRKFRAKDRRELAKLTRDFVRFYNGSKDKHGRKGAGRKDQRVRARNKRKRSKCRKYKSLNYYKNFYEFINNYVNEKLAALEAENATEELIRRMNIDKFTIRNGTVFSIGEIYAFFKHIIEKKLNSTGIANETILVTVRNNLEANDNQTTSSASQRPVLNNEIPSMENVNGVSKHRSKRIRKTSEKSVSFFRRKLLSLGRTSNSSSSKPNLVKSGHRISHSLKSKQFTPNELDAQQQSHSKRFLSSSELDNQIFLKNLYLNACEDEYRRNVERSILETNRTSFTALRRRKGDLEEHENK